MLVKENLTTYLYALLVFLVIVGVLLNLALHLYWWLDCDGAYVRAFIGYHCVPGA